MIWYESPGATVMVVRAVLFATVTVWEEVVAIATVAVPVFFTVYKLVFETAVGRVNVVVPETRYT
jgi:hypothetical protein